MNLTTAVQNSPPGVSVVLVSATDEDIMDTLVYDIAAGTCTSHTSYQYCVLYYWTR